VIRIVIADDQGMVRSGLRSLIEAEPDMVVVAEAPDGAIAVDAVRRYSPDVILMDIRMPELDGLAATRQLVNDRATTRIVVLTTFDLDEYVFASLRAGAAGFLLKDAPADDLLDAIRIVGRGEAMLAPAVTRRVIEEFAALGEPPRPGTELQTLSARETEVLRLLASGQSNAEIANALIVSPATAKTHVSNVLTKLGLRDRVQAVIYAYESGLIAPGKERHP
jgi:DNA-binding NarL/FixJ family response regulator